MTEAGSTMDEIVASVKRVTDIMAEITAASEEQSSGIEQVNKAISQMDNVTQQNAALVEEAAAAAESMQDQARKLTEVVSIFKVGSVNAIAVPAAPAAKQRLHTKPVPAASRPQKVLFSPASHADPRKSAHGASGSNDNWEEF